MRLSKHTIKNANPDVGGSVEEDSANGQDT